MAAAKIKKKPKLSVKKLGTPARQSGNRKMKASWSVPKDMVKSSSNRRATELRVVWTMDVPGSKDVKEVEYLKKETKKSDDIDLNNFVIGKTKYTRSSFYPINSTRYLYGVTCSVQGHNKKGNGPAVSKKALFGKPRKPELEEMTFTKESGEVSTTITTDAGADMYERYDTYYTIHIDDTRQGMTTSKNINGSDWNTEFPISYDVDDYQLLDPDNDYVKITMSAYARGFAGDSASVSAKADYNNSSTAYYVSYPAKATISEISVTSKDMSGRCIVKIKTNHTDQHPVDSVKLEYLANSEYSKKSDLPGDGWVTSSIVDDKDCTALSIPVAEIMPDRGKHTWVRVKSYHADEDVLYRYSDPMEVDALFVEAPTAEDDEIAILEAIAGTSGDSAVVQLGWNSNGQDDSDGTELSWSDEEDTWRSTEAPNAYTFTWSDKKVGPLYWLTEDTSVNSEKTYYEEVDNVYVEVTPQGSENPHDEGWYEKFIDHARITIKNLTEGSKYFIKARRYKEVDSGTSYSDYSNVRYVIPNERPAAVVANCDRYIPEGESATVRWTFSGSGVQTGWEIFQEEWYNLTADTEVVKEHQYNPDTGEYEDGAEKSYYAQDDLTNEYYKVTPAGSENPSEEGWYEKYGGITILEGNNSIGATQLTSDMIKRFAVNNVLTFTVRVTTGSSPAISQPLTVTIVEAPTIELDAPSILTAQNATHAYSFNVLASSPCDLIVIVTSCGISGQFPEGILNQVAGDTIFSDRISPAWTQGNDSFSASITLPNDLDFWDLGEYELSVTATDQSSGLKSVPVSALFAIEWDRQAGYPADAVSLTVIDVTDAEGDHRQAVQIDLTPPVESYIVSTDSEVAEGKPYYERSGQGTEESPYVFTEVTPAAGDNPSTHGWYELANDVYDIYRMDVEKPSLIGKGFPLFHTTVDEYAPFGEDIMPFYRIALRTEDGDVEFADIEYEATCQNIRFDWADGYLELPYGLTMGDSFRKDVEIRQHMNGSSDGYWNKNIERKSSLSSDVIRILQPDDIARARSLARYNGPVFVRLPYGSAFEADVQVTDFSKKNDAVMHVAFDATEIGLTSEFKLPIPYVVDETEEP